jgi:hypothetical protein
LTPSKAIRAIGISTEELSKKLADKGISFLRTGEVHDESSSMLCEVQGTIDSTILRGVAKIAFNYLAYWGKGDFVRQASFDHIRSFVRYGAQVDYPLVKISQQPILSDEGVKRRVGHLVTVAWAAGGVSILAQVPSLTGLHIWSA